MSKEIKRATGLLVIEVVNSNPNGDPDRESDPRQRPNGCGEISPVSAHLTGLMKSEGRRERDPQRCSPKIQ